MWLLACCGHNKCKHEGFIPVYETKNNSHTILIFVAIFMISIYSYKGQIHMGTRELARSYLNFDKFSCLA